MSSTNAGGKCQFGNVTVFQSSSVACPDRAEVRLEVEDPDGIWPEALSGEMCMRHGKLIEDRAEDLSKGKVTVKLKPIRYRAKRGGSNGDS